MHFKETADIVKESETSSFRRIIITSSQIHASRHVNKLTLVSSMHMTEQQNVLFEVTAPRQFLFFKLT